MFESLYRQLYMYCDGEHWKLFFVCAYLTTIVAHILCNAIFIIFDFTDPKFLQKYKVTDTVRPSWKEYSKLIPNVTFNVVVLGALINVPLYYIAEWRGVTYKPEEMDSWPMFLLKNVLNSAVGEIFFYYTHRLMHHRALYKHVHKVHHEYQLPISTAALYMHPIEFLVATGEFYAGSIIFRMHISSLALFIFFARWRGSVVHSGYHLPFCISPEYHDYHHKYFNECYGMLNYLDHFHGTDKKWCEAIEKKRDFVLFTTTPVKELVPDEPVTTKAEKKKTK